MTDNDLRRLLGMNAPLDTLSAAEFDALIYRIATLSPEHRLQIEAILRQDLQSNADLASRLSHGLPSNGGVKTKPSDAGQFRTVRTLALVFITVHSFAVTLVLLRLFHR